MTTRSKNKRGVCEEASAYRVCVRARTMCTHAHKCIHIHIYEVYFIGFKQTSLVAAVEPFKKKEQKNITQMP